MTNRNQKGAAMMETVVSLFVLAIGLLGTLGMQANSVNSNQRANLVTEANILAADMASRILAYNSDDITEDNETYDKIDTSTITGEGLDCSAGCEKGDAQKNFDAQEWARLIKARLPSGVGSVDYESVATGVENYIIRIKWHQDDSFVDSTCEGSEDVAADTACFEYRLRVL